MATFDEILAQAQAVTARINELAAEGERPLSFSRHNTGPVLVSPDPSRPGRWRATRFDADMQPTGHAEAATFREALEAAKHAGAIFL